MATKKIKKVLLSLIPVGFCLLPLLMLTSCAPISQDDVIAKLVPNLWVFMTHIFSAVLLISVGTFLVYKPSKKNLEERTKYIKDEIESANKLHVEAQKALEDLNTKKQEFETYCSTAMETAASDAYELKNNLENDAKKQIEKMRVDSENALKQKEKDWEANMKKQIIDIALETASSILEKEVSIDKSSEVSIDDLLKNIEKIK